jgi:hypothetical protein
LIARTLFGAGHPPMKGIRDVADHNVRFRP